MPVPGSKNYESDGSVTIEEFEKFVSAELDDYENNKLGGIKGNLKNFCYTPIID
jgi:hypothetical protein